MRTFLIAFLWILLGSQVYANTISGTPCTYAALREYLAPNPDGCDVGPLNYMVLDFGKLTPRTGGGYSFNSEGGLVNPDNLYVAPITDGGRFGLNFVSDAFQSDFGSASEIYFLSYVVDPPPILVGEELSLDFGASFARLLASTATPYVKVTEYVCPNNLFVRTSTSPNVEDNQCALGPGSETIAPLQLIATLDAPFDRVLFEEGVPLVSVHLFIELSGDLRGSGFNGVGSAPVIDEIPEPFSAALTASGLALLAVIRRRFAG